MSAVQVYDKPMCCSTGVCGPQVDPVLPRFAADLDWLKSQGHQVTRFNLAQQPAAFVANQDVHQLLVAQGGDCLPVIVVDGQIVSRGGYPSRQMLASWTQSPTSQQGLALAQRRGGCCGGSGCC